MGPENRNIVSLELVACCASFGRRSWAFPLDRPRRSAASRRLLLRPRVFNARMRITPAVMSYWAAGPSIDFGLFLHKTSLNPTFANMFDIYRVIGLASRSMADDRCSLPAATFVRSQLASSIVWLYLADLLQVKACRAPPPSPLDVTMDSLPWRPGSTSDPGRPIGLLHRRATTYAVQARLQGTLLSHCRLGASLDHGR